MRTIIEEESWREVTRVWRWRVVVRAARPWRTDEDRVSGSMLMPRQMTNCGYACTRTVSLCVRSWQDRVRAWLNLTLKCVLMCVRAWQHNKVSTGSLTGRCSTDLTRAVHSNINSEKPLCFTVMKTFCFRTLGLCSPFMAACAHRPVMSRVWKHTHERTDSKV